jgi:hypothetical protein
MREVVCAGGGKETESVSTRKGRGGRGSEGKASAAKKAGAEMTIRETATDPVDGIPGGGS